LLLVLFATLVLGSQAVADVVLDGNVDGQDAYRFVITDPVEGTFESPSWDVQCVGISLTGKGLIIGVDTVGPFDRGGGLTSVLGETEVYMEFRDLWSGAVMESLEVALTATTESLSEDGLGIYLGDYRGNGSSVVVGSDLEVCLNGGVMTHELGGILSGWMGKCGFYLRLDDTGTGAHDEVYGVIPEPATLAMLALGAAAILRRRGRYAGGNTSPVWSGFYG
jgi:hypothetical protein